MTHSGLLTGSLLALASSSKLKKGKAVKQSVTGIGRPTLTCQNYSKFQRSSLCSLCCYRPYKGQKWQKHKPVHIPAVPVLRSLPPMGPCATVAAAAYMVLINQPTSQARQYSPHPD